MRDEETRVSIYLSWIKFNRRLADCAENSTPRSSPYVDVSINLKSISGENSLGHHIVS